RRLLLQRFAEIIRALAQLIEQPRIFDGDDCLLGEITDKLDLLVIKRPHLLAVNADRPDQFFLLKHRHHQQRSSLAEFNKTNHAVVAFNVALIRSGIGNVDYLFRHCSTAQGNPWVGGNWILPEVLSPSRWYVSRSNRAKFIVFV